MTREKQNTKLPTKTLLGCTLQIALIILAPISVFLMGVYGVNALLTRPFHEDWSEYPTPDERVIELITYNEYGELFVRTADDHLFQCDSYIGCDQITSDQVRFPLDICEDSKKHEMPISPSNVEETKTYLLCGPDVTLQVGFVLLTDGTIWKWAHGWGWREAVASYYIGIAAAVVVLIVSIITVILINRKRIAMVLRKITEWNDSNSTAAKS